MAVDTKAKRSSVIFGMLPPPRGTVDRPERRQIGLVYRFSSLQSLVTTANCVFTSVGNIVAYYNLATTVYGVLDSHGYLTKSGEVIYAGLVTKVE